MDFMFEGRPLVKRNAPPDDFNVAFNGVGGGGGGAENSFDYLTAGQLSAMVENEPKKAKLDATSAGSSAAAAAAIYSHLINTNSATTAQAHYLAGMPIGQFQLSTLPQNNNNNLATSAPRSKVVHVRNIPPDMIDIELIQLCGQYGQINNLMMLKGKSQAFVEYDDENGAAAFVTAMATVPIQIRGRTIFAQFSTHKELKFDKTPLKPSTSDSEFANGCNQFDAATVSGTQQQPNSVLRVIIENMMFAVSLDVLHQLFSRFGKVLRIITFTKNSTFQALIQMSEANAAQIAKQGLENQNIYNGCCTMRIDYSKLSTLNVKYNNDKSRDYTNPNLPAGDLTLEHQLAISGIPGLQNIITPSPYNFAFGANPATTFLQPQLNAVAAAAAAISDNNPLSPYLPSLGGVTNGLSTIGRYPVNLLNAAAAAAAAAAVTNQQAITPVILVSNLDEAKVTTDALFTLFGIYGDVMRVKILYNKKDNALIQFGDAQQAQLAIQHLDRVKWNDKLMRVAPSKHTNVQMPKEGQPDAGLTRDYTHSTLHRFKKPGSKNYMNIYPPSSTLHLSNIPLSVTEEKLVEAFKENGFDIKAFKFFPKDHKMALIQLEDVETAIDALTVMHNHKLAENAHLRVSFSKSGI